MVAKKSKTSKYKGGRVVTKSKATGRTVKPKAKLRARKSQQQVIDELKDIKSIHQAIEKLENAVNSMDGPLDTSVVNEYIKAKREEEGRELDVNEKARIEASESDDITAEEFLSRAQQKASAFTTTQAVREGSYAMDRKFADTDFYEARKKIELLEDQIANATKKYLKSKRELVLLTKMLERAYHDMDEDSNEDIRQEAHEFNVAHLSRRLFPSLVH